ncbi:MAG: hypothetical protein U5L45_08775 [Saprospiraceae bacterium]|nr:hypothetical protein [Saprospiraceae bacterium]
MVHFSGKARKMNHFPFLSRAKRAQLLIPPLKLSNNHKFVWFQIKLNRG